MIFQSRIGGSPFTIWPPRAGSRKVELARKINLAGKETDATSSDYFD